MAEESTYPRFWDDLRSPATAINPPGAEADPDVSTTTGLLLFDKDATELCFIAIQMPHSWAEGSVIVPHVHWQKTTSAAGTVAWRLRYRYANVGEDMSAWSSPITVTVPAVSDADTAERHAISSVGELQFDRGKISMMWLFELARVGSGDTYAADAELLEFDVHYQVTQQPGSGPQWRKYD
jgi:hypothetical protein